MEWKYQMSEIEIKGCLVIHNISPEDNQQIEYAKSKGFFKPSHFIILHERLVYEKNHEQKAFGVFDSAWKIFDSVHVNCHGEITEYVNPINDLFGVLKENKEIE